MAAGDAPLRSNGWDRATRKPGVVVPENACDCAVHVFGASSLDATRVYDPPQASFDDLLRVHRTIGIGRGVIIQNTTFGSDHSVLYEALARGRGRYLGIALVDEQTSDAQLERLIAAGVRGARFNFLSLLRIDWNRRRFERVVARIAELGWITVVHGTADELYDRSDMLAKVPTPLIIDHLAHWDLARPFQGAPAFEFITGMLREGRAWIKLSNGDRISKTGPPFEDTVALAQAYIAANPERAIWATDWPHILYRGTVPNDAELIELMFKFAPDPAIRRKILVDNPGQLFRF